MKKLTIAFIGFALLMVMAISCKKAAIQGDPNNFSTGSYLVLDSNINTNLDFSNPAATVSIKVSKNGSDIASINVYVATGSALDTTKWVLIKNVPFTEGVVLSVTTAELAAALSPTIIGPGSQYVLQNQVITTDGRKFSVSNTPQNYTSLAGYNMALSWTATAVCAFTGNMAGTYQVIEDDWEDWSPGDLVQVTDGPGPNQINLSAVWPNPAYGSIINPLYADVTPTGAATVPAIDLGDYGYVVSSVSGSGFVFSCTGLISLTIDLYAAGYGDQGPKKLILQKQ
jgi:hypothetical protein